MWIFTVHGFLSAVCARRDNGTIDRSRVVVRARCAAHLEAILQDAGLGGEDTRVAYTPRRDYAYRVVLSREDFGDLLATLVSHIDYDNFKDACQRVHPDDAPYQHWLHGIWSAGCDLQQASRHRPRRDD
jgi:hypothetical protein